MGGSFFHPGRMMTNKASIRASWDIMVFGNGTTQEIIVVLCDPHC